MTDFTYTELVNEPVKRREEQVLRLKTAAVVASTVPVLMVAIPLAVVMAVVCPVGTRD